METGPSVPSRWIKALHTKSRNLAEISSCRRFERMKAKYLANMKLVTFIISRRND